MILSKGSRVLLVGYETFDLKPGSTPYFKGGTEVVTDRLLRYLQSKGCEVIYLTTHGRITKELSQIYSREYNCTHYKAPKDASELKHYIEDTMHFDLIINSTCMDANSRYQFKEYFSNTSVPTLVYNHGSNCCHIKSYGAFIYDNPKVHLISATEHEYREHQEFGFPEHRLHKIDNPVSLPETRIVPEDNGRFIINARMVEQKGIPNALDLCYSINKPVDLIGRDNNYKVYDQVMTYKDKGMIWHGTVDRPTMIKMVSESQMLVLLTNGPEGKSLVMLEAMALGTPVITWDDYSFSTFVDPEYNILLPHNRDYIQYFKDKYLSKLNQYLDYDRRSEMSKKVRESYGINAYYKRLDEIISRIGG